MALVGAACSGAADAATTTTFPSTTVADAVAANVASDDPKWDDTAELADLVDACVNVRTDGEPPADGATLDAIASGCLADARELREVGCSFLSASATLLNTSDDPSPGQCPAI